MSEKYIVVKFPVSCSEQEIQNSLNAHREQGYKVVTSYFQPEDRTVGIGRGVVIMEKEEKEKC